MKRRFFLFTSIMFLSSKLFAVKTAPVVHVFRSEQRGSFQNDWLDSKFSFSFSNWIEPKHDNFGALRVINEDYIAPLKGFKTHPHNNMEIITIPISGKIEHKDTMGAEMLIEAGEIQRMSAGHGIKHSEFNALNDSEVHLFQIWIYPKEHDIVPSYEKKPLPNISNRLGLIASGVQKSEEALYIHQNARILRGQFDAGKEVQYRLFEDNGAYIHLIKGSIEIEGQNLKTGDAISISNRQKLKIYAKTHSDILFFDVPMKNFTRN